MQNAVTEQQYNNAIEQRVQAGFSKNSHQSFQEWCDEIESAVVACDGTVEDANEMAKEELFQLVQGL